MEPKDNDILNKMFAGMSDEMLPIDFNEKIMQKVYEKAVLFEKKQKYRELLVSVLGIVAVTVVSVFVFYYFDLSIEFPKLELSTWLFQKPNFGLFKSQSFHFSLFIGIAALFLLIVDSTVRHTIEKRNKQHSA